MPNISVKAHFDGTVIQLDEPCVLPQNVPLLVTILASGDSDTLKLDWTNASRQGLERAYGEGEPDYSATDLVQ
jgi:hypothetical protein